MEGVELDGTAWRSKTLTRIPCTASLSAAFNPAASSPFRFLFCYENLLLPNAKADVFL
jgi:hypothetical protein